MKADRFVLWPACLSLTIVFGAILLVDTTRTFGFFIVLLSVFYGPILAIVIAGIAAFQLLRRRPRRAISTLLAIVVPILIFQQIIRAAEFVHLGMLIAVLTTQPQSQATQKENDFAVYDWSVGFAGQNTFLIHDRTDEIALTPAQHKHPLSDENGFADICAGKVRHLLGHYYICNFP